MERVHDREAAIDRAVRSIYFYTLSIKIEKLIVIKKTQSLYSSSRKEVWVVAYQLERFI